MSSAINKSIRVVHRWVGLTVGLVIVMMALTGSVNLFRAPLEPIINRDLLTVASCSERAPLDVLAANAQAVHSVAELDYVRIIAKEDGEERMPATRIRFTDQEFVYLNPCAGEVLGQRERYGGVVGSIEQLHILRFREDKERRIITAVCAIIFAVLLIGGGIYPAIEKFLRFIPSREGQQLVLNHVIYLPLQAEQVHGGRALLAK